MEMRRSEGSRCRESERRGSKGDDGRGSSGSEVRRIRRSERRGSMGNEG